MCMLLGEGKGHTPWLGPGHGIFGIALASAMYFTLFFLEDLSRSNFGYRMLVEGSMRNGPHYETRF